MTSSARSLVDPVTVQVIRGSLESICREMGNTMLRTAYSPIFVDGLDFSCALLDAQSSMVAIGNYCPVHLAAMPYASRWAVMEIGYENLKPGDVILHNDPYRGGTHITDFTIVRPVFWGDELVAIAANRAHHLDVGGKAIGGFPGDATDIFQEGIRIPPVKWFDGGVEREDIADVLLSNVRFPRTQLGDFLAQAASTHTAEGRLHELVDRYGTQTLLEAFSSLMDHSERLMRTEIAEMPDGSYKFRDAIEDDGVGGGPYEIIGEVSIQGEELTVDFTGTSAQAKGPVNAVYGVTASQTFNSLLYITDPRIPVNAGCFRPIHIVAPRGSLLNPDLPAPVFGGNTETSVRIVDVVLGALAQAVPGRVPAPTMGTCNNFTGGGRDSRSGRRFGFYFFPEGGWGGKPWGDGWNASYNQNGNCKDYPVEIIESVYPLRYLGVELNCDSEGAGKYRGGFGTVRTFEVLTESIEVNALGERHLIGPYGLQGGREAKPNGFRVRRAGAKLFRSFTEAFGTRSPSKFANVVLSRGDAFQLINASGGGWGSPFERDPEAVRRDVEEELVSPKRARSEYGVALRRKRGTWMVDYEATETIRRSAEEHTELPEALTGHPRLISLPPPEPPPAPRASVQSVDFQNKLDVHLCRDRCPKQGSSRKCPLYDDESLRYWSAEALLKWTKRHCPQAQRVVDLLTVMEE